MPPQFFFSSRRRHTRWTGDWSSDVCSSDLTHRYAAVIDRKLLTRRTLWHWRGIARFVRSEERRVGEECRARRGPVHYTKKALNGWGGDGWDAASAGTGGDGC